MTASRLTCDAVLGALHDFFSYAENREHRAQTAAHVRVVSERWADLRETAPAAFRKELTSDKAVLSALLPGLPRRLSREAARRLVLRLLVALDSTKPAASA